MKFDEVEENSNSYSIFEKNTSENGILMEGNSNTGVSNTIWNHFPTWKTYLNTWQFHGHFL